MLPGGGTAAAPVHCAQPGSPGCAHPASRQVLTCAARTSASGKFGSFGTQLAEGDAVWHPGLPPNEVQSTGGTVTGLNPFSDRVHT